MTGGEKGGEKGPVPVRDLMRQITPEVEADGEARWEGVEKSFEAGGVTWHVRTAGAAAYGTGTKGTARVLAVHFFREEDPERPVREALVPAGVFPHLVAEELRALFDQAIPIDLEGR